MQAGNGANLENSGITAGSFSVVGIVFALQFFSEVPKVRTDILQVCHSPLLKLNHGVHSCILCILVMSLLSTVHY